MAVVIPLVTTFDKSGISGAIKQFQKLETAGDKAQFAIKQAAIPAAAALTGLVAIGGMAVKASMEDAAAQENLARQLKVSTGATDAQVESVEKWIAAQGRALGIADDQLRPAFRDLARVTGSLEEAQYAAGVAMDIARAKGIPLEQVTGALEKAYAGNFKALRTIAPELGTMIKEGASADEVMNTLANTFGGAAADHAETAQGKMERFNIAMGETKEAIGEALTPLIEKALPMLEDFGTWAEDNADTITRWGIAVGVVAGAILAVNAGLAIYNALATVTAAVTWIMNSALLANPLFWIAIAVAALIAGLVLLVENFDVVKDALKKVGDFFVTVFDKMKEVAKNVWDGIVGGIKGALNLVLGYWEWMINKAIGMVNTLIDVANRVNPFSDIPKIPNVDLPQLAQGGIVQARPGGTAVIVGEGGQDEAVIPLDRLGKMGGGGPTYNINVQAGVGDPREIGRQIVDAIKKYERSSGAVFQAA